MYMLHNSIYLHKFRDTQLFYGAIPLVLRTVVSIRYSLFT